MNKVILTFPYSVARKIPKGDKKYLTFFKSELSYNHKSETYLCKINNCYITHYGTVLAGITFAPVLTSQMRKKPIYLAKLYLSCIKKIILSKVNEVDKECIVVHNNYVNNYYHWVLEIFFRLYLVKDYLADYILVLPKVSYSFQAEMLKLLNLEINQVLEIKPESLLKVKEALIPQYVADYGNYEPKLLKEYANWILSLTLRPIPSKPSNIKVYITRSQASYRRIVNEDKVIQKLQEYDFEICSLENLSFQNQIQLFHEATVIIAPHGAGLTNLIYCKPQTTIIELLPEGYIHPCFYTLADVFDLDYYYLIGKDIKNSPSLKPFQYDMEIDVSALENILKQQRFLN